MNGFGAPEWPSRSCLKIACPYKKKKARERVREREREKERESFLFHDEDRQPGSLAARQPGS